jgi:transcriptional regulator with XRE-family HTH domain
MNEKIAAEPVNIVEAVTAERLGGRIRALRQQRKLSLDALAALSGVSRAMLSKLERGENNPTLVVAVKVAKALGVTLSQLIGVEERRQVVIIRKDRRTLFRDPETGFERALLSPTFEGKGIEFVRHLIPVHSTSGMVPSHRQGSRKYLVVEQGHLKVTLDDTAYVLEQGDAFYFDANVRQRFDNVGKEVCSYYLVISTGEAYYAP